MLGPYRPPSLGAEATEAMRTGSLTAGARHFVKDVDEQTQVNAGRSLR